jgi:hypothetical protein
MAKPQRWQKSAPGVSIERQAAQTAPRVGAPQSLQNFPAVAAPQDGQGAVEVLESFMSWGAS